MNGKKAKLLRKLVQYVKAEQPASYKLKGKYLSDLVLRPESARAKYQTLKKAVKNGSVRVVRQAV